MELVLCKKLPHPGDEVAFFPSKVSGADPAEDYTWGEQNFVAIVTRVYPKGDNGWDGFIRPYDTVEIWYDMGDGSGAFMTDMMPWNERARRVRRI